MNPLALRWQASINEQSMISPPPSFTGAEKRCHRTDSRIATEDPFEDATAGLHGGLVRPGPQTHGSAFGLQCELCCGLVSIWTGQAER